MNESVEKPFQIRPIKPEDYEQWLVLWESYNTFYQRKVSAEVTQKTWERLLNKVYQSSRNSL